MDLFFIRKWYAKKYFQHLKSRLWFNLCFKLESARRLDTESFHFSIQSVTTDVQFWRNPGDIPVRGFKFAQDCVSLGHIQWIVWAGLFLIYTINDTIENIICLFWFSVKSREFYLFFGGPQIQMAEVTFMTFLSSVQYIFFLQVYGLAFLSA